MRRWSQNEIEFLKEYYRKDNDTCRQLALQINRSYMAVYVKANKLGLADPNYLKPVKSVFTPEEQQYLRDNINTLTNRQLAKGLGRNLTTTRNEIYRLGLKRYACMRGSWSEAETNYLIENYRTMGNVAMARKLKRSKFSVNKRMQTLKLVRTPEESKALINAGKQKFLQHSFKPGHAPVGDRTEIMKRAWDTRRKNKETVIALEEYNKSFGDKLYQDRSDDGLYKTERPGSGGFLP